LQAREEVEKIYNGIEVAGEQHLNQSNNARERIGDILRKSRENDRREIFEARKRAMKAVKDDVEARTEEELKTIRAAFEELSSKVRRFRHSISIFGKKHAII